MKRKIACLMAAAVVLGAFGANVYADEYTKVNLLIEGKAVELDQPAIIYNSRTMVPMRAVAENLGAEVSWDNESKVVEFSGEGVKVYVVVGSNTLRVVNDDGENTVNIDTPAIIENGRTLVPIAFLTEYFGYAVDWDGETKTVNVTKEAKDPNIATEEDIVTIDWADIAAALGIEE